MTRPLLALLLAALALFAPAASQAGKPVADDQPVTEAEPPPEPPSSTDGFGDGDFGPAVGERILSYRSDIDIGAEGTLTVTETIRVNAEGDDIRHGIYRDFPTSYQRAGQRRVRVGFDVQSVQMDGRPEHYTTERIANGRRVKIGDADTEVARGQHTYVIRYTTTRQLGFFPGYDGAFRSTAPRPMSGCPGRSRSAPNAFSIPAPRAPPPAMPRWSPNGRASS